MPDNPRPNPDELLQVIGDKAEGVGRLKIYIGMAAGVGKTYSMLSDSLEEKARGEDVVVGYLEHHGRKETEILASSLDALPRKDIDHRGVTLSEFDIDGALARRPKLILVDELAHSNAPNSRHAKRFQDIQELLDAGINVWTTVNIQHIESLRDVVAQVTGVYVQETVPDSFIDRADEIELVDIPPEQLQQRLRDGKVYVPEKADQALQGFFQKGNLLALRELALRHTAERVDLDMRRVRNLVNVTAPWHTTERILVCIAPNRMALKVVRAAKRLANSLHAELIAVTVSSSRQAGVGAQAVADMDAGMRLAADLGARTATLAGDDIVAELILFARQESVTTIVMGKPVRQRWKEILFGSVVDHTVRASGDIDVLIITGEESSGTPLTREKEKVGWSWKGTFETIIFVVIATGLGHLIGSEIRHANIIMVYLLGVSIVSIRHGRQEAILSSVLSVVAFNYFFVPPVHTLAVHDVQNVLTFTVMLSVALLLSSLTLKLKEQSLAASTRERNTAVLYELSRKLAGTRSKREMAELTVAKIQALFGTSSVVFRNTSNGEFKVLAPSPNGFERSEKEQAVAKWVVDHGKHAGAGTDTLAGAEAYYTPLIGSDSAFGALGVQLGEEDLDTSQRHMIQAIASLLSTALDRAQFAKASHVSALRAETERMRGDLLSAVSHDLRTPLASITGAASVLRDQKNLEPRDRELAGTILEESDRMSRLVRNLLDMTRVQGAVDLNYDWHDLYELVESAVVRTEQLFDKPVKISRSSDQLLILVDGILIEQVLVNLLENASRHAGRDCTVEITLRKSHDIAIIDVIDNGPGISKVDSLRIFERFRGKLTGGFGLGLAICKAAVEAHKGRIYLSSYQNGADFTVELPITEAKHND